MAYRYRSACICHRLANGRSGNALANALVENFAEPLAEEKKLFPSNLAFAGCETRCKLDGLSKQRRHVAVRSHYDRRNEFTQRGKIPEKYCRLRFSRAKRRARLAAFTELRGRDEIFTGWRANVQCDIIKDYGEEIIAS